MLGAVLLALVPACSSGSDGNSAASPVAGEPTTLHVALSEEPGVLDPHAYTGNFMLLDMIYEPLVSYGEDGVLEPGLAESWEVSDDGLRVTFHLRQGVTFHDGTPFDAEAVKWNLERWVGGADHTWFQTSKVISEVNVVDPVTVELVLSEPFPPVVQELSMARPVRFLSPAAVGPDGTFAEAVGTGPWTLESSLGDRCRLGSLRRLLGRAVEHRPGRVQGDSRLPDAGVGAAFRRGRRDRRAEHGADPAGGGATARVVPGVPTLLRPDLVFGLMTDDPQAIGAAVSTTALALLGLVPMVPAMNL